MGGPSWFRTDRHVAAEARVTEAIRLIVEARRVMTLWEFEKFIRDNIHDLGGHGFVGSIGKTLFNAATIEHERTETAQKPELSTITN